jgi:hypothetical protein
LGSRMKSWVLGHCLVVYEAIVHWLRLQTHVEWIPALLYTFTG